MAATEYSLSLLAAMDQLWFNQVILCCEPATTPLTGSETVETLSLHPIPKFPSCPSPISLYNLDLISDIEHNSSSDDTSVNTQLASNKEEEEKKVEDSQNHKRNGSKLCKSMSFGDLELEEVKGFMDLGFEFEKKQVIPKLMVVLPGLKRLIRSKKTSIEQKSKTGTESEKDDNEEEEEKMRGIVRSYLSEAWSVKKPARSPLLLKLVRTPKDVSSSADMKRHIRLWAKTVASELHYHDQSD